MSDGEINPGIPQSSVEPSAEPQGADGIVAAENTPSGQDVDQDSPGAASSVAGSMAPPQHTEDNSAFQQKEIKIEADAGATSGGGGEESGSSEREEAMLLHADRLNYQMKDIESLIFNFIGKDIRKQYRRLWTNECNDLFRLQSVLRKRARAFRSRRVG